jgi:protein phosphatase
MGVVFEAAGKTDQGRVRKRNEDQFLIADLTKSLRVVQSSMPSAHPGGIVGVTGHLLAVADGMGGLAGGEIASGLTVETLAWFVARTMPWFFRFQDGREPELEAELVSAVEACRQAVAEAAAGTRFEEMGTTLTLAHVLWPRAYIVHLGDSRCYLHRDGHLKQLTRDHTIAQRAMDEGLITGEEARGTALGHTLWNCIGGGAVLSPDVYRATLQPGDELLLCTDGLTRKLTDARIAELLESAETPGAAVEGLVGAANAAGGEDNITVIVARVLPVAPNEVTPPDGHTALPAV